MLIAVIGIILSIFAIKNNQATRGFFNMIFPPLFRIIPVENNPRSGFTESSSMDMSEALEIESLNTEGTCLIHPWSLGTWHST